MSVTIKLDSADEIKRRLGIDKGGRVTKFLINRVYTRMDKYVPKDIGNLRTNVRITDSSVTYQSPYASYQYYGIREDGTGQVINHTTSGTGSYWDRRMMSVEKYDLIKEVQNFINKGG